MTTVRERNRTTHWYGIAGAVSATLPGIVLRFSGFTEDPVIGAGLFGLSILGAAILLAWAAEAAQVEISRALAIAFLALIAVLPEYAVDLVFVWKAPDNPEFASYAAANMTGANRLLIGIGWALVVLLFWARTRRPVITLERRQIIELAFLLVATGWAFTIFLRTFVMDGALTLLDSFVLVGLFLVYLGISTKGAKHQDSEVLIGPPATIASMSRIRRRVTIVALFVFSALAMLTVAEPFAENLIAAGEELGVDKFILVQWVAPLASETPEIVIALLFTLRGLPALAMAALISAKVNQWTLLVGTLPVVYSISAGGPEALPLDSRQADEFLLTAAQSLFAVILLISLKMSWKSGAALLVLFVSQLFFTDPMARTIYSLVYLGLTLVVLGLNAELRTGLLRVVPRLKGELAKLR